MTKFKKKITGIMYMCLLTEFKYIIVQETGTVFSTQLYL